MLLRYCSVLLPLIPWRLFPAKMNTFLNLGSESCAWNHPTSRPYKIIFWRTIEFSPINRRSNQSFYGVSRCLAIWNVEADFSLEIWSLDHALASESMNWPPLFWRSVSPSFHTQSKQRFLICVLRTRWVVPAHVRTLSSSFGVVYALFGHTISLDVQVCRTPQMATHFACQIIVDCTPCMVTHVTCLVLVPCTPGLATHFAFQILVFRTPHFAYQIFIFGASCTNTSFACQNMVFRASCIDHGCTLCFTKYGVAHNLSGHMIDLPDSAGVYAVHGNTFDLPDSACVYAVHGNALGHPDSASQRTLHGHALHLSAHEVRVLLPATHLTCQILPDLTLCTVAYYSFQILFKRTIRTEKIFWCDGLRGRITLCLHGWVILCLDGWVILCLHRCVILCFHGWVILCEGGSFYQSSGPECAFWIALNNLLSWWACHFCSSSAPCPYCETLPLRWKVCDWRFLVFFFSVAFNHIRQTANKFRGIICTSMLVRKARWEGDIWEMSSISSTK